MPNKPLDPLAGPFALLSVVALLDHYRVAEMDKYEAFLARFPQGLRRKPSQEELGWAKNILDAIDAAVVVGNDESWAKIKNAAAQVGEVTLRDKRSRAVEIVETSIEISRDHKDVAIARMLISDLSFLDRAFKALDEDVVTKRLQSGERGLTDKGGGAGVVRAGSIMVKLALSCGEHGALGLAKRKGETEAASIKRCLRDLRR